MEAEAAITSLVNQLQQISVGSKIQALDELKTAITALPLPDLRRILPNLSINNVFECLNTQDKQEQKVCCEVLDRMLTTLSPPTVVINFHSHLLRWLRLPDDSLKALCLPQISRLSKEVPSQLCQYEDLVEAVADQLTSDSPEVGPPAVTVLTNIGEDPLGLQVLFRDPILGKIVEAMQKNDITRFRIYQIATDLSKTSSAALNFSVAAGLLQELLREVQANDILVQLNAIELISDLAQSSHGLAFLDHQGIVGKLEEMMLGLNENPMMGLLLPGLIKFFGGLSKYHPKEVLSKFDHFVKMVLNNVDHGEPTLKGLSVDTIGFIASTPEGKLALDKIGNPVTECIHSMGNLIRTGPSELKARSLQAMSNIIYLEEENQTDELLNITQRWFSTSMSDPFNTVWSIAQQPFLDLRVPAFQLLHNLAALPWGQRLMNNVPGFKEYLLDRSTEHTKEGKDVKFELIKILAHSPTAPDIFGRPYHVKLTEYFNQGPFYVVAQSEVAMEGE
ncbi:unnamed protein product [Lymnaea stagnalis]|uniref:26S proteasome non-ATPase regulatory subunit 5 n=1 Tax=Lymnaea stagnalis TaxID=6523 RepID=A0AAV2IHK9_LYMST